MEAGQHSWSTGYVCYLSHMVLVNSNSKVNADKHTHLEWFSPSETVMRQIPWQVSMSPFWTASLS